MRCSLLQPGSVVARFVCTALLLLAAIRFAPLPAADAPAAATFDKDVKPLLASHCLKCHGAEKPRAGVNLTSFADEKSVLKHRKLWRKVMAQIESQEMPPAKEAQLTAEQRERVVGYLKEVVNRVDCNNPSERDPGRTPVRRLNRTEYNRTLRDLLGIDFDSGAVVGMPDDTPVNGYDNLATALTMSPALTEKYFAAADKILERLLGPADPSTILPKEDGNKAKQTLQARQTLLFVKPGKDVTPSDAARKIVERLARLAFRRPVEPAESERLLKLFDRAQERGATFENSLRPLLKAILVSPHFLYRIEQDRPGDDGKPGARVNDHELAVRLAYFLWSTLPDATLSDLADQKKLSDPAVLEAQVKRMLADPKARALTDNFGVQWLQLRKLEHARPNTEFFPTFNHNLRRAMYEETVTFFDKLREEDKSILDLLDANYTYVNQDLAKHYGIDGVQGGQMRRVELKPEHHRGGLLGQASILTLTSHTSRTSPTMRGKWVLDVVFGTPPPPPPPDAGMIKDEQQKGKTPKTFRELMAQHAQQATCAACHKKMDPLGYALDSYDAVGRWREDQGGRPLDVSGELPTGEKITGPDGLKKVVRDRQEQFIRNLSEQMLTYALGREVGQHDECTLREMADALKKNEYRFSALVLGIVKSYPFQNRRGSDARFEDDD